MNALQQTETPIAAYKKDIKPSKTKEPVHLEVITNKNPNSARRKNQYTSSNMNNTKIIDVDNNGKKTSSPIKGIVQKVTNI